MKTAPTPSGALGSSRTGWSPRLRSLARAKATLVLGATVAVGLLLFPFVASANHQADAFFIFSKAEHGKFAETNCDGSNDKQADVSGSFVTIHGRVHSNADFAASGQNITFEDPVTFGTFDGAAPPCQSQAGSQNSYLAGPPANLPGAPPGLNEGSDATGGWPGNLNDFLSNSDELTFSTIGQVLPGETCDVGSLSGTGDITLTAANNGQIVCNGTGKVQLGMSGQSAENPVVMSITIVSHGPIEFSGQHVSLSPAAHGVLAVTDQSSLVNDVSVKLAGSNFDVPDRGILFTPRSGQDISGSVDSELCIQAVGQGRIKVAGSGSAFGPGLCESAIPAPELTLGDFPDETTSGQSVALQASLTNTQSFAYADVRFRMPIPTTIVNGSPVKAVLKYASCTEQLTATELVCENLSTLGPGDSAEVTVVWQTPSSGSSSGCPLATPKCLTSSGTWTVGALTFPTGVVVTPLLSPSDPNKAATYTLTTCTNASTQSTVATNQTLGTGNPLATKVCAPGLPLGDPLNPGLVASVAERDHLASDPGVTQVSSICVPAPGESCSGGFLPFVFAPTKATFTFVIDNRSLPKICPPHTGGGGGGGDDDDDDDGGDGCTTEKIDQVFHDGALVSSSPSADPRVVSITVNNSKRTTTVVVRSSENGDWTFG